MKSIRPKIPISLQQWSQEQMLQNNGFLVHSYEELTKFIAELACENPNLVLFYRGQKSDYKSGTGSEHKSTILPTIYRNDTSIKEMDYRWKKLNKACELLVTQLKGQKGINFELVRRKKLIQWSILQHYEVVDTPLIDVTQSIRVACSFALLNNDTEDAYIYVIGLPYYTNRISVNSEEYLTNIRLISIVPPIALRPYHQEGFLVGEDDIIETNTINKTIKNELDLRTRLVYKFRFIKEEFRESGNWLNEETLMPENDQMKRICDKIKIDILKYSSSDLDNTTKHTPVEELGHYLSEWQEIESLLIDSFGSENRRGEFSLLPAIKSINDLDLQRRILRLKQKRNIYVHKLGEYPSEQDTKDCKEAKRELINNLQNRH